MTENQDTKSEPVHKTWYQEDIVRYTVGAIGFILIAGVLGIIAVAL